MQSHSSSRSEQKQKHTIRENYYFTTWEMEPGLFEYDYYMFKPWKKCFLSNIIQYSIDSSNNVAPENTQYDLKKQSIYYSWIYCMR